MILLAQGVALVEFDHLVLGGGQVGPPALDLDIRY
jgi:hypothetical protein